MTTPRDVAGGTLNAPQEPRSSGGGQQTPKTLPYSPPVGPVGINDPKTAGLHGTNHGNCGTQGKR